MRHLIMVLALGLAIARAEPVAAQQVKAGVLTCDERPRIRVARLAFLRQAATIPVPRAVQDNEQVHSETDLEVSSIIAAELSGTLTLKTRATGTHSRLQRWFMPAEE